MSFAARRWPALVALTAHERKRWLSEMLGVALEHPPGSGRPGLADRRDFDLALVRQEWVTLILLIILSALFSRAVVLPVLRASRWRL